MPAPMISAARLLRNSLGLVTTVAVTRGAGLLMLGILSRALGVAGLGEYSLALATGEVFRPWVNAGLDQAMTRRMASGELEPRRALPLALQTKVPVAGAAVVLALLTGRLLGYQRVVLIAIAILGLDFVFDGLTLSLAARFNAALRARALVAPALVAAFFYLGAGAAGYATHGSVAYFVAALMLSNVVLAGSLLARLPRDLRLRDLVDWRAAREVAREAIPLGAANGLVLLYSRIDTILLARISGTRDVGYYAAGYRLTEAGLFIGFAAATSLLPAFAALAQDPARLAGVYAAGLRRVAPLVVLVSSAGILAAPAVVKLLYGPGFGPAAVGVSILALATPLMCLNKISTAYLVALGRRRPLVALALALLALNAGLNLALIPAHGFVAAAAVTVVTELANLVVQVAMVCSIHRSLLPARSLVPGAAALVLAPALVLLFGGAVPPLVGVLAVGALVAAFWASGQLSFGELLAQVRGGPAPGVDLGRAPAADGAAALATMEARV